MRLKNTFLIAVLATAVTSVLALSQTYGDDPHMGAWGWGGMLSGLIMMVVFIALVVGAVFLILRLTGLGSGPSVDGASKARQILDERFARGEIDKDDFEERRRVLSE